MSDPVSNSLPVTYANRAPAAPSGTATLLDPQAFLQLLVAQLKYQDPADPVDTSALMSQSATLSQVQTMNAMSSALTSLVSAQQAQEATSMIGKQVTYLDAAGDPATGVVDATSLTSGTPTLRVGGVTVALADVQEVSAAAP
jgi:flagellar basal-body rod modification protein FlgD